MKKKTVKQVKENGKAIKVGDEYTNPIDGKTFKITRITKKGTTFGLYGGLFGALMWRGSID